MNAHPTTRSLRGWALAVALAIIASPLVTFGLFSTGIPVPGGPALVAVSASVIGFCLYMLIGGTSFEVSLSLLATRVLVGLLGVSVLSAALALMVSCRFGACINL